MKTQTTDQDLVGAYARDGSESAFRTLVAKHIQLVYATALRQTGNHSMAEEITQNTFMALARKAPRLATHETIAGWLHRTALLEAKLRIRTELRRQRREESLMEQLQLQQTGSSVSLDLSPLLDEALCNLRDSERTALLLRFFEDLPLAEVGIQMGITPEAARKRVDRALQRVSDFFRNRGFSMETDTLPTLLAGVLVPVPASLSTTTATAALAAGAGGSLTAQLVALLGSTQAKGLLAGLVLASIPASLGWQQVRAEESQYLTLNQQIAAEVAHLQDLNAQLTAVRSVNALTPLPSSSTARPQSSPPPEPDSTPLWLEDASVVRVPKSMIASLDLFGVKNNRGKLSEAIILALQLTPDETFQIEEALGRFLQQVETADAASLRRVDPAPMDLLGRDPKDVRVFELSGVKAQMPALREGLFKEMGQWLDPGRLEILKRSLRTWMPMDDEFHGLNSSMGVFQDARRVCYYPFRHQQPGIPGEAVLMHSVRINGGMIQSSTRVEDIPPYLQTHLQDWIDEANQDNTTAINKRLPSKP